MFDLILIHNIYNNKNNNDNVLRIEGGRVFHIDLWPSRQSEMHLRKQVEEDHVI